MTTMDAYMGLKVKFLLSINNNAKLEKRLAKWITHKICLDDIRVDDQILLSYVLQHGTIEQLDLLIKYKINLERLHINLGGGNALNMACRLYREAFTLKLKERYTEIIRILCTQHVRSNIINNNGQTCLMEICAYQSAYDGHDNHKYVVKLLLDNGAIESTRSNDQRTAVMIARDSGYVKLAKYIEDGGWKPVVVSVPVVPAKSTVEVIPVEPVEKVKLDGPSLATDVKSLDQVPSNASNDKPDDYADRKKSMEELIILNGLELQLVEIAAKKSEFELVKIQNEIELEKAKIELAKYGSGCRITRERM